MVKIIAPPLSDIILNRLAFQLVIRGVVENPNEQIAARLFRLCSRRSDSDMFLKLKKILADSLISVESAVFSLSLQKFQRYKYNLITC